MNIEEFMERSKPLIEEAAKKGVAASKAVSDVALKALVLQWGELCRISGREPGDEEINQIGLAFSAAMIQIFTDLVNKEIKTEAPPKKKPAHIV